MNELTIFNNPDFGEIRTVIVDNETLFVSKDVGEILGYNNPRDAVIYHVDEEDRASVEIFDGRQTRHMIAVNESGLYALIMNSKLPSSKKFKHWVTSEVIPSIRKNGGYIANQENLSDEELMAKALMVAQKTIERREQEIKNLETEIEGKTKVIEELTPKATYYDVVLECPDLITTTEISKDYGMSAAAFNNLLHELGIQFKQSKRWFLYTKYEGYGYTQSKTKQFTYADGSTGTKTHMYWTQKGRLFLYEFLKKKDIIPMIEKYA